MLWLDSLYTLGFHFSCSSYALHIVPVIPSIFSFYNFSSSIDVYSSAACVTQSQPFDSPTEVFGPRRSRHFSRRPDPGLCVFLRSPSTPARTTKSLSLRSIAPLFLVSHQHVSRHIEDSWSVCSHPCSRCRTLLNSERIHEIWFLQSTTLADERCCVPKWASKVISDLGLARWRGPG